jgi:hypothetical protein
MSYLIYNLQNNVCRYVIVEQFFEALSAAQSKGGYLRTAKRLPSRQACCCPIC